MQKIAGDRCCGEGNGHNGDILQLRRRKEGFCRGRGVEERPGEINKDKIIYIIIFGSYEVMMLFTRVMQ